MGLAVGLVLTGGCSLAVGADAQGFDRQVDARPLPPTTSKLILNEVAPAGDPDDWFEVYNGTTAPIDLARYLFSDSPDREPVAFREDLVLEPGAYHVEFLDDTYPGFGLGAEEQVLLYLEDGESIDSLSWTEADGIGEGSLARLPDVEGAPAMTQAPTPGYPNQGLLP